MIQSKQRTTPFQQKHSFKAKVVAMVAIVALSGCSSMKASPVKTKSPLSFTSELVKPSLNPNTNHFKPVSKRLKNNYPLNANKTLEIIISEHGYTRFFLQDERITDVFVYPQENIGVKIHSQGYLIVVPQHTDVGEEKEEKTAKETIYLTVTGENGTTQDFSLRFTGKNPEPVQFVKSGNK